MAEIKVIAFGVDLYDLGYIEKLPNIKQKKTFRRDLLISNSYNIEVTNTDNFFSLNNSNSPLQNINWLYTEIIVYGKNGIKIWEGVITNISRDHNTKKAILFSKSKMYQFNKRKINYVSSDWETPATAFRNICDQEGFTNYNNQSVDTSEQILQSNSCYIKCNFETEDNINFMEVISKLGDYSNSDVYSKGVEIYFQHWKKYTGGAKIFLDTETDIIGKKLKSLPVVSHDNDIMINDYSIGYYGDSEIPATDSNNNNIGSYSRNQYGTMSLPETKSNDDSQIVYKDSISAVYIGESNIQRTHKNYNRNPQALTKINFNLYSDHREYLDLNTFFKLTFPDEGWFEKTFEMFEYSVNEEQDNISCMAYEVVE